jgi:hypothetical protein
MPATHSFDLSSLHISSLPNTTLHFVSVFFFLDQQKRPFSGPHKLLILSPIGSLNGHVRAQWFHSVSQRANENWDPLFHFPPACYIIRNFQPVNYLACHQRSCWYLAQLIQPWRWRRYSS